MIVLKEKEQWLRFRCFGREMLSPDGAAPRRAGTPAAAVKRAIARMLSLVAALVLITGCVTTGASRPSGGEAQAKAASPSVQRLTDGRQGFVVQEVPQLTAAERDKFLRAAALLNEQQFEQAAALLEEVVAQSPKVTAPYINLAIAYGHLNQAEKAEALLAIALALFPGHPVAGNEYGLLLRKAGKFAEARKIYEQSLEKFPEYSPLHRNLGILCDLYLNDLACAREHYAIYSENTPDDEPVKKWIADLNMRMGNN